MGRKVTVVLDDVVYDVLRVVQGRLISETARGWSMSEVINRVLVIGMLCSGCVDVGALREGVRELVGGSGVVAEELSRKIVEWVMGDD